MRRSYRAHVAATLGPRGCAVPGLRCPRAALTLTLGYYEVRPWRTGCIRANDAAPPRAALTLTLGYYEVHPWRTGCIRANGPAHVFPGQRPGSCVFGPTARFILAWGEAPGTDSVSVGVGHRSTSSAPDHGDEALLQSAYGGGANAPGLR